MLHVLVISLVEHPWNKIKSDYGCPKKRKDGMPKKHDPKKRERERGNHVSKKREETRDDSREKTIASRSKPHPSVHPSIHTLAPFDWDCMTCFSMDHLFDFTIYGIQVCPVLILPWPPQRLVVVGKIKGSYCPSKEIQVECLKRVILGTSPCFQKFFQKVSPDGLQIYEQVTTTLCTILTLNSPRRGDS